MSKHFITETELDTLVKVSNAFLADENNTQEDKSAVFFHVSNILIRFGKNNYRGFNWIKWSKQGGASQFFKDCPERAEGMTTELYCISLPRNTWGKSMTDFFIKSLQYRAGTGYIPATNKI